MDRILSLPAHKLRHLQQLLRKRRSPQATMCTWCHATDRKVYLRTLCRRCYNLYYVMGTDVEALGPTSPEHAALWAGHFEAPAVGDDGLPAQDVDNAVPTTDSTGIPYPVTNRPWRPDLDVDPRVAHCLLMNSDGLCVHVRTTIVQFGRMPRYGRTSAPADTTLVHIGGDMRLPRRAATMYWDAGLRNWMLTVHVSPQQLEVLAHGRPVPSGEGICHVLPSRVVLQIGALWLCRLDVKVP